MNYAVPLCGAKHGAHAHMHTHTRTIACMRTHTHIHAHVHIKYHIHSYIPVLIVHTRRLRVGWRVGVGV